MSISFNSVAKAYQNTADIAKQSGIPGGTATSGIEFGKMVKDAAGVLHQSEQVVTQALTKQADVTDVVNALTQAELMLQTVVSVRDKFVQAYDQITKMPI